MSKMTQVVYVLSAGRAIIATRQLPQPEPVQSYWRSAMPEMSDAVIRDPAFAAAAGKCWLARMMGGRVGNVVAAHPTECAWCEFPPEYLIDRISEFLHWAGAEPGG